MEDEAEKKKREEEYMKKMEEEKKKQEEVRTIKFEILRNFTFQFTEHDSKPMRTGRSVKVQYMHNFKSILNMFRK